MTIEYTPEPTLHEVVHLPEDGEEATAERFNVPYREIADNAEYLRTALTLLSGAVDDHDDRAAFKDEANTFTQPQTVPSLSASGAVAAGSLSASGALTTGGDATIGGALTTGPGEHILSGGSLYTGTGGQVVSDTHVLAGATVSAGGHVEAPFFEASDDNSGYRYETPPTRLTILSMSHGHPVPALVGGTVGWSRNALTGNWIASQDDSYMFLPIDLPNGAVIQKVEVLHDLRCDCKLTVRQHDFAGENSAFNYDFTGTNGPVAGPWNKTNIEPSPAETVDNSTKEYAVLLKSTDVGAEIVGIRLTWTDPGPRNH